MNRVSDKQFIITKEYRKFAEFCDACRLSKYIGICYGPPGVGKTLSAKKYSNNEIVETFSSLYYSPAKLNWIDVVDSHTIYYTSHVKRSVGTIEKEINQAIKMFNIISDRARMELGYFESNNIMKIQAKENYCELIIVDEVERLDSYGIDLLRDIYDNSDLGIILIGMPGIEKSLSRYAQLYSRVGFVHNRIRLRTPCTRVIPTVHTSSLKPPIVYHTCLVCTFRYKPHIIHIRPLTRVRTVNIKSNQGLSVGYTDVANSNLRLCSSNRYVNRGKRPAVIS